MTLSSCTTMCKISLYHMYIIIYCYTSFSIVMCYHTDVTARRNTIANALELVKVTKGKVNYITIILF